jgi:putative oxidoreductase
MANTVSKMPDIADLPPLAYAVLVTRIGLGLMYLGHAAMMWAVLGLADWWSYAMTAAEIAGGVLLLAGLYVRQVAIALIPLLLGTAIAHVATGSGATLGFAAYFVTVLAGQALLAGWAGASPIVENLES